MGLADILQADADMADLLHVAAARLREAAAKVRALSDEYGGELRGEARLLALAAIYGDLSDTACLYETLRLANNVAGFVENWTDCAKPQRTTKGAVELAKGMVETIPEDLLARHDLGPGRMARVEKALTEWAERLPVTRTAKTDEEFFDNFVTPAAKAVSEALDALIAIVDARTAQEGAGR